MNRQAAKYRFGFALPMVAALATALLCPPPAVSAQETEEILSFDVRVEVGTGGVLRVTEAIRVRALGRAIQRGIYRDFPTHFPREPFGEVVAPFEVVAVLRDGNPEPYAVERVLGEGGRGGVRIRIGDAGRRLEPGVHEYVLEYETARWVQFGDARDRLDWNVTGNGWRFPIRAASATIALPGAPSADQVELAAWTGPEGSTAQEATWSWDPRTGAARFETTSPLGTLEGLTVRVDVPAGVIPPPTPEQRSRWARLDWGGWVDAGVAVSVVLGLYLLMWMRVGRDPPPGPVVVRYEPPEGFSPAALGFLEERGHDPAQVSAAVVSLAVEGAVTLEKEGRDWRIRATGDVPESLTAGERKFLHDLLGSTGEVSIEGRPSPRVRAAASALRKRLEAEVEKRYFVLNRGWFSAGLAVSALAFGALAWRYRLDVSPEIWFLGLWITFWTIGVGTLLYRVVHTWKMVFTGNLVMAFGAVFLTLFALPFVGAELFVGYMLYQGAPRHLIFGAVVIGLSNVAFYHLLERPTLAGRGVLDRVAGFREYLGATDRDRLDRMQPPDRSLELFERYLPHAIALGVENRWAERFEGALVTANAEPIRGRRVPMAWYSGGVAGGTDLSGMSSSLGTAFSTSLSSASAAPSSGGSGGGGGSSGGGGGGGGGGGW